MPSRIPTSGLGRALKAGIPVVLIMAGAELIDGDWSVERGGDGLKLSWSSAASDRVVRIERRLGQSGVRLDNCFGPSCNQWTFAITMPEHGFGSEVVSATSTMIAWATQDCPEQRQRSRTIAML